MKSESFYRNPEGLDRYFIIGGADHGQNNYKDAKP